MSQFKVLAIVYQMCEYFRSFLRMSHQFCVFDLDEFFIFYS